MRTRFEHTAGPKIKRSLCSLFFVSSSNTHIIHNTYNFWTPALFVAVRACAMCVHSFWFSCMFFLHFSDLTDVCLNIFCSSFLLACLGFSIVFVLLNMRQKRIMVFPTNSDRSVILLENPKTAQHKRMCNKQKSIVFARNVSVIQPGSNAEYLCLLFVQRSKCSKFAQPELFRDRTQNFFGIYCVCNS